MMGEGKKERGVDVGIMSSECVPFQEEHEEGGHLFGRTGGGRWHLQKDVSLGRHWNRAWERSVAVELGLVRE